MSVSFSTIVQRARPKANHIPDASFRDVISKLPPTIVTKLPNGLQVSSEENSNAKFATIGAFINAGTRYDTDGLFGTARVLEKSAFLGTTNQSRQQLADAVDEIGGHLHVETGRELNQIYLKVAKENVDKAVSLIADVVRNARLSDEDVSMAKNIVAKQLDQSEERVDEVVFDNVHRAAYDSTGAGLGAPLYGDHEGIKAITPKDVKDFRAKFHTPERIVLVGTGAVSHTQLENAAKSSFGDAHTGKKITAPETRYVGGDYKLWNLRFPTTHLVWGFETCGAACEDSIPLGLATQIHGGFHRSQHEMGQHAIHRVFKTYSSQDHATPTTTHFPEKGIETINSYLKQYSDSGLCGMYIVGHPAATGGDAANMQEIWQYSMSDWCRMTQKMLHQQELDQAKVNYKSQALFNQDGATNSLLDIGKQVSYTGRRIPLDELYARVDDVTATNVQETLQHYFYARRPVYSFLGYTFPLANYDWSSMWTYKYWY